MASTNIFDTLRQRVESDQTRPEYERRAMYWFSSQRGLLTEWQRTTQQTTYGSLRQGTFTKQLVAPSRSIPGRLYFFRYNPLNRKTLPYYDRFPLVLVLEHYSNGDFLGLNFHYLNYFRRARLFDALYSTYIREEANPLRARLATSYDLIKDVTKYKAFRPCLKRYAVGAVQTPLLQVGVQDWDLALFLPVDMFARTTKGNVWLDSETSII